MFAVWIYFMEKLMADDSPKTVAINYLKSNDFREIACDGAIGGPTPHGKLWVAFYSERFPLPRIVEHNLIRDEGNPDQVTIDLTSGRVIESRSGIVRHIEFGAYLSLDAAKSLHDWLGKQLNSIQDGGETK
jgi:hypothetical protein